MNILLFTAIYPAKEETGIPADTKAIHYFAKQWANLGHRVEVIYLYQNPLKRIGINNLTSIFRPKVSEYWYEGIHVNLFEIQLITPHANRPLRFQIHNFERLAIKKINKLDKFIPDLISMHFPMSFYSSKIVGRYNCPSIAVLHNCDINTVNKLKQKNIINYLKQFKKLGSRNKKIQFNLFNQYNLKSDLIYSGISEELIENERNIKNKIEKKYENDICDIMFAGNLIPLKRVDDLLKASVNLNFDYRITIVGEGVEKNKLIDIAKGLNIEEKVVFTGRLSRDETVNLMKKSDVFVMTSSPETFGLVYLEAMAQGCITIGSKNEGIDGIIINGYNGYLVLPGDINQLSKVLNNIYLLSKDKRKEVISNGYNTAYEMTSRKMAEKYLDISFR